MRIAWLAAAFGSFLLLAASCGADPKDTATSTEGGALMLEASASDSDSRLEDTSLADTGVVTSDAATTDAGADAMQPACVGKLGPSGDRTVTINSGGLARSFDLHVPATYDPTKHAPVVILFHGYTMSATTLAATTHFGTAADTRGMIVAFPVGTDISWNAGECCGPAQTNNVDDVGFTRDLITALEAEYCVDEKRVFATGFSNGAFFAYRLACELADKIAAVAPVAGVIGMPPSSCNPQRPVPLLHIHGTGDVQIPYNGSAGAFRSVAVTVDAFRTKNGCAAGDGAITYQKDDVTCRRWSTCTASADVELCTVTGGGHQWPGGEPLPYGGSPTPNLIASEHIASFFAAHPMP